MNNKQTNGQVNEIGGAEKSSSKHEEAQGQLQEPEQINVDGKFWKSYSLFSNNNDTYHGFILWIY